MLHDLLEQFFRGGEYPAGERTLSPWRPFMEALREHSPSPEAKYAVTETWESCDYDHPETYFRGAADLRYKLDDTVYILDWKSGKMYPDHPAQGRAYMAMEEDAERYVTKFVYLDNPGLISEQQYVKGYRDAERKELSMLIDCINVDTVYEPTPSQQSCQWCPLSWRKNGGCTRAP